MESCSAFWGIGNELSILNMKNQQGRSLILDFVPPCLTTPLYLAGQAEHVLLSQRCDLLGISKRLRSALALQLPHLTSHAALKANILQVLSTWKALEIMMLENETSSIRQLLLEWVNAYYYDGDDEQPIENQFDFALSLLLRGKVKEASDVFSLLATSRAPSVRAIFLAVSELCHTMPLESNEESVWTNWQTQVRVYVHLHPLHETADKSLTQVFKILLGEVPALVRYFQAQNRNSSTGSNWAKLLAAVVLFKAPCSTSKKMLGELTERCSEPFPGEELVASKLAFQFQVKLCLGMLNDFDSWSECYMAQLFLQEEDVKFRIKFGLQLGLGGRGQEGRPSLSSLLLAQDVLKPFPDVVAHIWDRVDMIQCSEAFALGALEICPSQFCPQLRRIRAQLWMQRQAYPLALFWAKNSDEEDNLLAELITRVIADFEFMSVTTLVPHYQQQQQHSLKELVLHRLFEMRRFPEQAIIIDHLAYCMENIPLRKHRIQLMLAVLMLHKKSGLNSELRVRLSRMIPARIVGEDCSQLDALHALVLLS